MPTDRRNFLKTTLSAGVLAGAPVALSAESGKHPTAEELDRAAEAPVLKRELFKDRVEIASIELLKNGREFMVRATSTDGAVGIAVVNSSKLRYLYPILVQRVAPFFIGKDARDLDSLIDDVFVHQSNYKLQGVAFWVPVASVEFAILDLLGKIAGKSVREIIGDKTDRTDVPLYRASGTRGNTPEEEVATLERMVAETGAEAIKFKVGGRMRKNVDSLPGRSEALIPMVREALGDEMTIYSDSNGSYDAEMGTRIGKMMEEQNYGFYEEPCRFDHLEETKQVADALEIPISGGEQETSLRRFRWMIENGCVQIVQPDLFYFGGMVRAIRVARMAALAGMPCTPHMSGSGLGFMYVLHFAGCVPDVGPHQEYKGKPKIPFSSDSTTLASKDGKVTIPTGPGWGVEVNPDFVAAAEVVTG